MSICNGTGSYNISWYGNCLQTADDVVKVYGKLNYDLDDKSLYNKLKDYAYKKCDEKTYRKAFVWKSRKFTVENIRLYVDKFNK